MSQNLRSRETAVHSPSDLPPPRDRKKAMRPVSPPLSNVSLSRFNYALALFAVCLVAFYSWRVVQWKSDVGGWWNLALGRKPPAVHDHVAGSGAWASAGANAEKGSRRNGEASVEQRIEELATALGIPSTDLANAIAGAVRDYVPPASLSSVAAHESGDAVKFMVDPSGASSSLSDAPASTASRGFQAMGSALEAVVGMDEPPSDLSDES